MPQNQFRRATSRCKRVVLLLLSVFLFSETGSTDAAQGQYALRLEQVRTIAYRIPLPLPQGLQWVPEGVLAAEPHSSKVWSLLPNLRAPVLTRREDASSAPRATLRQFELVRFDARTGEITEPYGLAYDDLRSERPGFALSRDGQYMCTISQGKVRVLGRAMSEMHSFDAGLKRRDGEVLSAMKCGFVGESTKIFVLYLGLQPLPEFHSAAMIYDWTAHEILQTLSIDGIAEDAICIGDNNLLLLYMQLDKERDERLLAKLRIDGPRAHRVWQERLQKENGPLKLGASSEFVFLALDPNLYGRRRGLLWVGPSAIDRRVEVFPAVEPCWARRPVGVNSPTPKDAPCVPSPPPLRSADSKDSAEGEAHTWRVDSGKPGPQFRLSGYWLHSPLTASDDGRWLAIRATHFKDVEQVGFTRWDDTRFAIFDLNGRLKEPLYLSENFGPDEAIIDLGFTADGSALVVATTARLIIYDVKEASASKYAK